MLLLGFCSVLFLLFVCFLIKKEWRKKSSVLKNRDKEMGIIRAATGIKEINVIIATSAGEVVLLLLPFIIQKLKGFCLGILSCSRSCAELSTPQMKPELGLAGQHYRLTGQEMSCS